MMRRPKCSKIEVVAPKEEEEEKSLQCITVSFFVFDIKLINNRKNEYT
jgi:hypothetical protein